MNLRLAKLARSSVLAMYWFSVNRTSGCRALASREAHSAEHVAASCREGLTLWSRSRSGRNGAKKVFAPAPVSAPGTAHGSHTLRCPILRPGRAPSWCRKKHQATSRASCRATARRARASSSLRSRSSTGITGAKTASTFTMIAVTCRRYRRAGKVLRRKTPKWRLEGACCGSLTCLSCWRWLARSQEGKRARAMTRRVLKKDFDLLPYISTSSSKFTWRDLLKLPSDAGCSHDPGAEFRPRLYLAVGAKS